MKVLFVDDNESVLSAFRRNLRKEFEVETAETGDAALKLLQSSGPFAVVVSDMKMPGMSGIEFLERAMSVAPDTVRVMLTGNVDQATAVEAVNRGHIFRFLNKPCSLEEVVSAVRAAGAHHEATKVENRMLEQTVSGCVKTLSEVLGMVAPFALGRGQRLQRCIGPFVRSLQLKAPWVYDVTALLSSIGYTSLPTSVVTKLECGEPLEPEEAKIVRETPQVGYELVSPIPKLEAVARAILYHRKNYDGSGFPVDTISRAAIPLPSRILRVFEDRLALERDGVAMEAAKNAMLGRDGHYDPRILDASFRYFPGYLDTTVSKDREVHVFSIGSLEAGQIVVSDISTHEGVLLVEAGNALTPAVVRRIKNYATLGQVSGPFYVQMEREPDVTSAR